MKKLFTLALAMLASVGLWAQTTASWTFEENATGIAIADAGSASTARALYSSVGSSIGNAAGSYCIYANLGSTKGSSTKITTSDSYDNIEQISMLLGTSDRGKTEFALQVSPNADFSSNVTNVQAQVTINGNISAVSANNSMATVTYDIDPAISGYVRIVLAQASGSNNKKMFVDNLSIKYTEATADPVAEVTVAGAATASIGYPAVYTASTDVKADAYKWFVNDVEQDGATAKSFTLTPAAAGSYSIVCKARNANNVTDEWIASDAKVVKACTLHGELIKATLTSGSAATVTGIVGGTADVSLNSSKKMDKGKYFGFTLAKGAFAEGDTVVINLSAYGQNYPCLFADKNKETLLYLATETSTDLEYKIVLPAAANGLTSLYFARDANDEVYKWNPTFTSVSVIRPMAIKSTVETLKSVTIAGEAINLAEFVEQETDSFVYIFDGEFVTPPTVVYTKHVVITYDDDSQAERDIEITPEPIDDPDMPDMCWASLTTIGGKDYAITIWKKSTYTATFKYGEEILGTQDVDATGSPTAEYIAILANKVKLANVAGWYLDAGLNTPVDPTTYQQADPTNPENVTFYGKFDFLYAQSVNIEQLVLENGKTYNLLSTLGTLNYATNWTNDLDSIDESKSNRNYPYLGEKVKATGKMIDLRLVAGSTIKVKFGNVPADIKVVINGVDSTVAKANLANPFSYTAAAETYMSIRSTTSGTLVFKQIMIDKDIQDVVLNAKITVDGETVKGAVGFVGDKLVYPVGTEITLTNIPEEGYELDEYLVYKQGDETTVVPVTDGKFIMPNYNVVISGTFKATPATALDNTADAVKAVKRIENGQLFIEKNGVIYNAQGARLQ